MSTHEREITEPVDLADTGGKRLHPDAVGWSRTPLHRANLSGGWGRTKRWDYWAILAGDLVVSTVYADVDYIGLANVWWARLDTGESGGADLMLPLARGVHLPDLPGSEALTVRRRNLELTIADQPDGSTTIDARWTERDGTHGRLEARVGLPEGHQSLNVVIPWSDTQFQYTSKHQARPVTGTFSLGTSSTRLEDADRGAWGTLDVGRGRWPYHTTWNWGGGAGRATADGTVVGLQLGGKWTEGTAHTENGFLIGGRLTKIGSELVWDYEWDNPMSPWTVWDPEGQIEAVLTPRFDRHNKTDLVALRTEVHQVFGDWSGHVVDDNGSRVEFEGIQGFAEESRSRW